jgi:hypothetical protein
VQVEVDPECMDILQELEQVGERSAQPVDRPAHDEVELAPGGAYGLAYDFLELDVANAAALGQCSGDCKLATAMRGNCAALSIDMRNACGAFGYAAAPRLGQAQNTALRYCYRNGGKDCVIRAWVCDAKG